MKNDTKENISISLPGWLIELLDKTAKSQFINRSDYVSKAIRRSILTDLSNDSDFWESFYDTGEE